MKYPNLLKYKDALKSHAYFIDPDNIKRISVNKKILDDYELNLYSETVDPFILDQIKILNSKSLRRESSKTQVFYSPDNPHIRTRMSHTHEVESVSSIISHILGLNIELTRSIAFGHDIGHGPTGHLFEQAAKESGIKFRHEVFSAIIAVFIEGLGLGLNLTQETINGILDHSRGAGDLKTNRNSPNENNVVMYSDKIAYIFSDINDLERLKWLSSKDIKIINSYFPGYHRERVGTCITALIEESAKKGKISFENSEIAQKFLAVKKIMYQHYDKLDHNILNKTLKDSFDHIRGIKELKKYDPILIVALMTDKELHVLLNKIIASQKINIDDLKDFGVYEIIKSGFLEGATYQKLEAELHRKLQKTT